MTDAFPLTLLLATLLVLTACADTTRIDKGINIEAFMQVSRSDPTRPV
jgi:hypothetical protein